MKAQHIIIVVTLVGSCVCGGLFCDWRAVEPLLSVVGKLFLLALSH